MPQVIVVVLQQSQETDPVIKSIERWEKRVFKATPLASLIVLSLTLVTGEILHLRANWPVAPTAMERECSCHMRNADAVQDRNDYHQQPARARPRNSGRQ